MTTDDDVRRKVMDALTDAIDGSSWQPKEGALLVESVVCLGWVYPDGTYGRNFLYTGSPWSAEGLTASVQRDLEDGYMPIGVSAGDWDLEEDEDD